MKSLFPKTIEEWTAKKRQFMKLLQETEDSAMAKDYTDAINFCDRGVIGIHRSPPKAYKRVKYAVIVITIAVILAIVLFGCRSTIRGTGQVLQGVGIGTGTIVTGIGNYLVEEGQE